MFDNKYSVYLIMAISLIVVYYLYTNIDSVKKDYFSIYKQTVLTDRRLLNLEDTVRFIKSNQNHDKKKLASNETPVYSITYDQAMQKHLNNNDDNNTHYAEISMEEKEILNKQMGGKLDQIDAESDNKSNNPVKINVDVNNIINNKNPMLNKQNKNNNKVEENLDENLDYVLDEFLRDNNTNNINNKRSVKKIKNKKQIDSSSEIQINDSDYQALSAQLNNMSDMVSDLSPNIKKPIKQTKQIKIKKQEFHNMKRAELQRIAKNILNNSNKKLPKPTNVMTNNEIVEYIYKNQNFIDN